MIKNKSVNRKVFRSPSLLFDAVCSDELLYGDDVSSREAHPTAEQMTVIECQSDAKVVLLYDSPLTRALC